MQTKQKHKTIFSATSDVDTECRSTLVQRLTIIACLWTISCFCAMKLTIHLKGNSTQKWNLVYQFVFGRNEQDRNYSDVHQQELTILPLNFLTVSARLWLHRMWRNWSSIACLCSGAWLASRCKVWWSTWRLFQHRKNLLFTKRDQAQATGHAFLVKLALSLDCLPYGQWIPNSQTL